MATETIGKYTVTRSRGKMTVTSPDKHGTITVYGNGHAIPLEYLVNDDGQEVFGFRYRGWVYDLEDIMSVGQHAPAWMRQFDGHASDSFFSGILVKWYDNGYGADAVQAYTYIG